MAARRQPGDAIYVYYGAGQALRFHGPRYGFAPADYQLGGCHRGDTRAYLYEVDRFRGRPHLWVLISARRREPGPHVDSAVGRDHARARGLFHPRCRIFACILCRVPPCPIAMLGRVIRGYHGTRRVFAREIIRGQAFLRSTNDYEWLGTGIYFFEGLNRAWEWAGEHFGTLEAAVVCADIDLGLCLDLTDVGYERVLAQAHKEVEELFAATATPLPDNTKRGAHRLDCAVIDYLCTRIRSFDTVRGMFLEGPPVFPGSAITAQQAVQVCVRNPACICKPIIRVERSAQDA